ncbi:hypothetical protein BDZ89DRAFT_1160890 [Hymenopellis radicata]|nr:hypothetical protein BDZ89DRAFT_1160890 [Hymenopellis radicata]
MPPMDSAQQKDHIWKPRNSLSWQEFAKSVRLEGKSMTGAQVASMLWAVTTPEEMGEGEESAADDRKAHAATLRSLLEFLLLIAQKDKRTPKTQYPADSSTSTEVPGRSHSAADSAELAHLQLTCSSSTPPTWNFPGLEIDYQDSSSFSSPSSASSLSDREALYDDTTIIADIGQRKLASSNKLLHDSTSDIGSSALSYSHEILSGRSTVSAPPEVFNPEPHNPDSEPVCDRTAIDGDFTTDPISEFFELERFLADHNHETIGVDSTAH